MTARSTRWVGAIVATVCVGLPTGAPLLAGHPPNRPLPATSPRPPLKVLHRHTTRDGRIVANWIGEDPSEPDMDIPLHFGVAELWFEFRGTPSTPGNKVLFRPAGTLFFSDWTFDIFSPDGAVVVLLQDHYGPFHVVRARILEKYLTGR
ncbi:MAG TPA: hypothetical protein VJU18_07290, partial [Vicinamibacteria bacterium]|nr:hypothetical protein [Vicinamibacteria bacterium]